MKNMKFFIRPKTDREIEIWDSGWRCGLLVGLSMGMIVLISVVMFIK